MNFNKQAEKHYMVPESQTRELTQIYCILLTCENEYITNNDYWSTDLLTTDFTDYWNLFIDGH